MEPRGLKKLAPAPAPTNGGGNPIPTSLPTPGPRKNLTRNACSPCKVKKAKCDGNRPACGRCNKSGDACLYEVNRRDILKLQLLSDNDIARLQNFELVFGALQSGTNQQGAELLAQIRLGESVDTLASTLSPSAATPSTPASSLQPMVSISSSSVIPSDNSSNSSTEVVPQGFLDLLFDRDDWPQPTESTAAHSIQTPQEEMHGFASDPVAAANVSILLGSDRPSPIPQKTFDLPISVDPIASHPEDGFSDGFDQPLLSTANQGNHYPGGTDSLDP
ncbi:hypothetical protein F4820DRAFT_150842 [Hypoxylon rubiginosum]|uniref:Uncharacterized protein n=1 Tax=Hypoxylon rubiginosum TaxID=110542 RepID=A0ACB9Z940_9PEZI|nr:hypothetical protein F4820DRAFT_150842 [Hypoxylon rubiginosum]